MSKQLHKNFTDGQIKSLLKSYLDKKIKISYILQMLRIKRSRFFKLLARYKKDPDSFSIQQTFENLRPFMIFIPNVDRSF